MNQEKITALLDRYHAGNATDEDLIAMDNLLEKGLVKLEDLSDIDLLERKLEQLELRSPSVNLDDRFYQMLAEEKRSVRSNSFNFREWFSLSTFFSRLVFASVVFIAGLGLGYAIFKNNVPKESSDLVALSNEVRSLKEMMMLSLLEKESATDRLKAVNLSQELEE